MSVTGKEIYEFGDFRLDAAERTIERIDGLPIPTLPEKTFDTLVFLVRKRGHLVPRDELFHHVWPDAIVEENNLEKRVHQLRNFLGETSSGGKYIETVRRHGYRFVAPVSMVEVSGSWLPATYRDECAVIQSIDETKSEIANHEGFDRSEKKPIKNERPRSAWPRPIALISLIVLAAIAGGFAVIRFSGNEAAGPHKFAVAILPLCPVDASRRDSQYEHGVLDSIIHRLGEVDKLYVMPIGAVRPYTDFDKDPVIAGRELKADFVLASNYQLADGKIRISSRLVNVRTGKIEDTYRVETAATGVFAVQDAAGAELAAKLASKFNSVDSSR